MKITYIWSQADDLGLPTKFLPHHFWADDFRLNWKDKWEIVLKLHKSKICSLYWNIFLTAILDRLGIFFLLYFISIPISIWTFLSNFQLEFYFLLL